jgi:predicted phage terminase large subunit-like protein
MVTAYDPYMNRLYIRHAVSDYLEMPECLKFTEEYAINNQLQAQSRIYIEPKASGKSLTQLLNADTNLNAVEIESQLVREGKNARLQTAAPKIESGRVFLVEGSWNDEFRHQLTDFPVAEHDEYVDLIGYATDFYFSEAYNSDEEQAVVYDHGYKISDI